MGGASKTQGLLPVVMLAVGLVACGGSFSGFRSEWVGGNSPGHMWGRYQQLEGTIRRSFDVQPGQVVAVRYTATVRRGHLEMEMRDPAGRQAWWVEIRRDDGGTAQVVFPVGGEAEVLVHGADAEGSFDLQWSPP